MQTLNSTQPHAKGEDWCSAYMLLRVLKSRPMESSFILPESQTKQINTRHEIN